MRIVTVSHRQRSAGPRSGTTDHQHNAQRGGAIGPTDDTVPSPADHDDHTDGSDQDQPSENGTDRSIRVQRTVNFDKDLLERARAAASYLSTNEPHSGVRSLADIVNPAVAELVAELETRYNDGRRFHPVARMPIGRPRRRSPGIPRTRESTWVQAASELDS